jgi:hypothetical protein
VLDSRPVTLLLAAGVGALFVAGLAVDGVTGAVLLMLVLAGMVALSAAAWERIPSRGRAARIVLALAVAGLVVLKLTI